MPNEYKRSDMGMWELPAAHKDDFGGRPGLDGQSMLAPAVIDPDFNQDLPPNRVISRVEMHVSSGDQADAAPKSDPMQAPAGKPPASPPLGWENEQAFAASMAAQLAKLLQTSAVAPAPAPKPPVANKQYITVTLQGDFGTFKSRAAEVLFYENHVALLYTGDPGHDDLLFQPPLYEPFTLSVPLTEGGVRAAQVVNFGLTTVLPSAGGLLVVLLINKPKAATEPDHGEAEYGHAYPDPMQQLSMLDGGGRIG